MKELELKEEFKKYLKDSSDYYDPREPITDRKLLQMWLDCAEPREKKITKLECQVNKLKEENEQLKAQIEKMKCCHSCKSHKLNNLKNCQTCDGNYNKWEFVE